MIPDAPPYPGPERRRAPRWRPRPLRLLLSLLGLVVIGYAAAVIWLMTQETRLVFQAGETLAAGRPPFAFEHVEIPRADGERQFGWRMPLDSAAEAPWVLFLHGNASTIASHVNISHYRLLRAAGFNVFAPEYRGFGGLEGVPTEESLAIDARAAYDLLEGRGGTPPSRIVLYGWSLGSAVAVRLASEVEHAAVILEGAPASLADIGQRRYPLFPVRLVMRSRFESIRRVGRVRGPMLFLHSPADEIIPIEEGRRLYDAAPPNKRFVEVGGGHVDASQVDEARFVSVISAFMKEHGLTGTTAASR